MTPNDVGREMSIKKNQRKEITLVLYRNDGNPRPGHDEKVCFLMAIHLKRKTITFFLAWQIPQPEQKVGYCPECEPLEQLRILEDYNDLANYRKHMKKSTHKKKLNLSCPVCGKQFTQQEKLKKHPCLSFDPMAEYTVYNFRSKESSVATACTLLPMYETFRLLFDEKFSIPGVCTM